MDLMSLVTRMQTDGDVARITRNPLAQFGPEERRYVGATILPERTVDENAYVEDAIRYRTIIANDGTRYSPAQLKDGGEIVGSFQVILGNQDIARQFTGRTYEAFLKLLRNAGQNSRITAEAVLQLTRWLDVTVNRALIELGEKQRWDALINASVVRKGDNGYQETVTFPNPTGHRVAAGGVWSNDAYDPLPDMLAMAQVLWDKGYTINRAITSRRVMGILANNDKMSQRVTGRLVVNADGTTSVQAAAKTDPEGINRILVANELPAFETYDEVYFTQHTSARFMPNNIVLFTCNTGRDEVVAAQTPTVLEVIPDTLGYYALGIATNQLDPGRVINMFPEPKRPQGIYAEGYQTAFPVLTEPEAVAVITGIS